MRIAFWGYLPKKETYRGGAEVKTKSVLRALREQGVNVKAFDTSEWKKNIIFTLSSLIIHCFSEDAIILIASTGTFVLIISIIIPICKLSKCKVLFVPVGDCEERFFKLKYVRKCFSLVTGVFVQTKKTKDRLNSMGFRNIFVMHNFKYLDTFLTDYNAGCIRFVYFSRITTKKGIIDAIEAVVNNNKDGYPCYLDIYGMVEDDCAKEFYSLVDKYSEYISYLGFKDADSSSKIIKNYYMMIFPTRYETEGFPGAILDALAAGVPVISSRFGNYDEILSDHYNSLSYEFGNVEKLQKTIKYACEHFDEIIAMRENASITFSKYLPQKEIKVLIDNLGIVSEND